jgi:hypothetical protein
VESASQEIEMPLQIFDGSIEQARALGREGESKHGWNIIMKREELLYVSFLPAFLPVPTVVVLEPTWLAIVINFFTLPSS